jgi:alkylation response protein AidB-like acyl-CoA dehydrogenase
VPTPTYLPSGLTANERANAYAATVHAYESSLEATRFAFRAAGAGAVFRTNRLQRCLRDIETGSQHILASEEGWERIGRYWLGLEEPFLF